METKTEPKDGRMDPKRGTKETAEPTAKQKGKEEGEASNKTRQLFPNVYNYHRPGPFWTPLLRRNQYSLLHRFAFFMCGLGGTNATQSANCQGVSRRKGTPRGPLGGQGGPKGPPWRSKRRPGNPKKNPGSTKTYSILFFPTFDTCTFYHGKTNDFGGLASPKGRWRCPSRPKNPPKGTKGITGATKAEGRGGKGDPKGPRGAQSGPKGGHRDPRPTSDKPDVGGWGSLGGNKNMIYRYC